MLLDALRQRWRRGRTVLANDGFCPTCQSPTRFVAREDWLRDHYVCSRCGSIPRERALMLCIQRLFPGWRDLRIHESSPGGRGASETLRRHCPGYSASQLFPALPLGEVPSDQRFRNEDLENLTLHDESVDLFVTQDVMEHVLDPGKAFREIGRVLAPGGAHVFTVPLVSKEAPTCVAAIRGDDGKVVHLMEPTYHGNPVDPHGSLVTRHWGYDIAEFILEQAAMPTTIVVIDDLHHGVRAEYIEVLVSRKPRRGGAQAARGPGVPLRPTP